MLGFHCFTVVVDPSGTVGGEGSGSSLVATVTFCYDSWADQLVNCRGGRKVL